MKENKKFQKLISIVRKLRKKCPWDKKQTVDSIKNNIIEEVYELVEAIEEKNESKIIEEIGDVLLQVVFLSQIKKDEGKFEINQVIDRLMAKLIKRHPHVFGKKKLKTADAVLKQWYEIKQKETRKSILDGIPKRMPALIRAVKLQERASKVGFDWEKIEDVYKKVEEELTELKKAKTKKEKVHELGDLLIAVSNLARFMKVDPEQALHLSLDRMVRRFNYIEEKAKKIGKPLKKMSLEEMDKYWEESKVLEEK